MSNHTKERAMKVGPHVRVENQDFGGYRVIFQLTDGPHVRISNTRGDILEIIQQVLPNYLTPEMRRVVGR